MRILVDAMGGDHAPEQIVLGALDAVKSHKVEVVLLGKGDVILDTLKAAGLSELPKGVEIHHTDEIVEMHDDPASVIKKKPGSSMVVGLKMLSEGQGDAFVSAGSTGALLTAATLIVRRIKGIRRAAMGPVMPTAAGNCVLMDCGANAECTPDFLLQFAHMGSIYAEKVLGKKKPTAALLNIGTEDTKGGALQKEAYALLKAEGEKGTLNFIGNIEAREVPLGGADVVISDGFTGNILLKGVEGTAKFMAGMMKEMFKKNIFSMIAALLCKSGIDEFKKKMDYRETGGTAMVGLKKTVIKAHGSSDRRAIECAIGQAVRSVQGDLPGEIEAALKNMYENGDEHHVV